MKNITTYKNAVIKKKIQGYKHLLSFLIDKGIESVRFYQEMISETNNQSMKKVLANLAIEELDRMDEFKCLQGKLMEYIEIKSNNIGD